MVRRSVGGKVQRAEIAALACALVAVGSAALAQPAPKPALPSASAAASASAGASAPQPPAAAPFVWRPETKSPAVGAAPLEALLSRLQAACGAPDAALADVASRNVRQALAGLEPLPADELVFALRAAGNPHVWPRGWSLATSATDDEVARKMAGWTAGWSPLGVRRCAVDRGTRADGSRVVSAVAVDALADLMALPTSARVGQWMKLEARMLVPATAAKVVLLGPRGAPKTVLASLSGGIVRSTFSVDQPGAWLVQVLATGSTGPRPVLEAVVHAGTTPPDRFVKPSVPGESAAAGGADDDDALLRMMNAARAAEGMPALARDPALDRLARLHSAEMVKARMVGHDVGGGDPGERIRAAGIKARVAGENVASASSLENAHRAIWASPSHRGNLLFFDYRRAGVSVVRTADGRVWVTELFVA